MGGTLGEATIETGVDLAGLEKGMGKAQSAAERGSSVIASAVGGTISFLAFDIINTISDGFVRGFSAAVNASVNFDTGMREVFTLLPGISQSAMDAMSDQVLAFSQDFAVLPEDVVPALYQSLSAGVPQDNVFSFLETAQMAAVGGVTDLTTAVDGITSVMNAYGSETVNAGQASDIMFTAVRLGKTNFEELSSSLFNVIPTAASAGVAFGDIASQLAVITSQGVPTSVATTQIRSAITEATKSGTDLSEAIQELTGSSFADLIAQGSTMPEIFQSLRESMPEQAFKDLFPRVEALNGVLAVTGPNFDTVQAAMSEMNASAGATEAAFETMAGGAGFSMDRLKAFGQTVLIQMGDAISPFLGVLLEIAEQALPAVQGALDTVIGVLEPLARVFQDAFAQVQNGVDPLTVLHGIISRVAMMMGMGSGEANQLGISVRGVVAAVQSFIQEAVLFLQPIIEAVSSFVSWKDVALILAGVLGAVVISALASLIAAIAPVVAIVVGAIAIVALLRNAWETNFLGIRDIVQNVIAVVTEVIQTALANIQAWWQANGDAVIATAQSAWETIKAAVTTAIQTVLTIVQGVLAAIQSFWAAHGDSIMVIANAAWAAIQSAISTVIATVQSVVTAALTAIQAFWAAHGETIMAAAQAAWDAIQAIVDAVTQTIGGIIDAFAQAVEGDWTGFGETLRDTWDTMWEAITTAINSFSATILQIIVQLALDVIDTFLNTDWGAMGRDIIDGVIGALQAGSSAVVDAIIAIASASIDAIKAFFNISSPSKLMYDIFTDVVQGGLNALAAGEGLAHSAGMSLSTAAADGFAIGLSKGQWIPGGKTTSGIGKKFKTGDLHTLLSKGQWIPGGKLEGGISKGQWIPGGFTGNDDPFEKGQWIPGGKTAGVTIYIDARGAQPGVGTEVADSLEGFMARRGRSVEARIRSQ